MYLSVIVPAYNEALRIGPTIEDILRFLSESSFESELIIVDDGSIDETSKIVKGHMSHAPFLRLVSYSKNMGKGYAIKEGILASRGKYLLFMDADNSTTIDQVVPFIRGLESGADIVVGSRRLPESEISLRQPWFREALGYLFRLIVASIVSVGVSDSQAGFKALKRVVGLEYAKIQKIDRWAFDVELLAVARAHGRKIIELPIIWKNDADSRVRLLGMINMLFDLIKIRYYMVMGYYHNR